MHLSGSSTSERRGGGGELDFLTTSLLDAAEAMTEPSFLARWLCIRRRIAIYHIGPIVNKAGDRALRAFDTEGGPNSKDFTSNWTGGPPSQRNGCVLGCRAVGRKLWETVEGIVARF